MIDYNKRLVEVDEVLRYLAKSDFDKIPDDVKEAIKQNKDKNYEWNYDESKSFAEQDLPRDTIVILSYLNTEYLLNEEQKKLMEEIHENNEKKAELEKTINYEQNLNSIKQEQNNNENVENTENVINNEVTNKNNTELVEYKENIFTKIKNFFKNLFKVK